MYKLLLASILTIFLIAACSDDNNPTDSNNVPTSQSSINGTWVDSASVQDQNKTGKFKLSVNLTESNGVITGNYEASHKYKYFSADVEESSSGTISNGIKAANLVSFNCNDFAYFSGVIDSVNNTITGAATLKVSTPDTTQSYIYQMTLKKQ